MLGAVLAVFGFIFTLGACGDVESGDPTGTGTPVVTGIIVNPDTVAVKRGQTRRFSATVQGTNDPEQTVPGVFTAEFQEPALQVREFSVSPQMKLRKVSRCGHSLRMIQPGGGRQSFSLSTKAPFPRLWGLP
jgi:hypothetical protein